MGDFLFIYIQDNLDAGVLYLLRGLLNILQNYLWEIQIDYKVLVYIRVLVLLLVMS